MSDDALDLLRTLLAGQRDLLAEVRALREAMERGRGPRPSFNPKAANLLRAIDEWGAAMKVDHPIFSVRELKAYAAMTPDGEAMRAAIGTLTAKSLGKFLGRIEKGGAVDGLRVVQIGKDGHGVIWAVRAL